MKIFDYCAHPSRISQSFIEAPLREVFIGEICQVEHSLNDASVLAHAQVVAFKNEQTLLSLIGRPQGLTREVVIRPMGHAFRFAMNEGLLGKVYNAAGEIVGQLNSDGSPLRTGYSETVWREINTPAIDVRKRRPVTEVLVTGVKAIDSMLTCARGQRMGIFAAAGSGKTSLMNMILRQSEADVFVIALIGERGREVTEFIHELSNSSKNDKTIIVYATSDSPAIERCNAALIATAIAEYFRDNGKSVLLFVDSMTRYARALRDVALAAGELPARRGYPASIFEQLPQLLERPGAVMGGAITAFYTVLLESEDEADPIGEEVRSILDGHIYLSSGLAGRGHYPAIDILNSISRLQSQIISSEHKSNAIQVRDMLGRLEKIQLYLDMGEYQYGENPENDRALDRKEGLQQFLRQSMEEPAHKLTATLDELSLLAAHDK